MKSTTRRAVELHAKPVKDGDGVSEATSCCFPVERPRRPSHIDIGPLLVSCSLCFSVCRSPPGAAAPGSRRGDPPSGRSPPGLRRPLSRRGRRSFSSSAVVTKNQFLTDLLVYLPLRWKTHTQRPPRRSPGQVSHPLCLRVAGGEPLTLCSASLPSHAQLWFPSSWCFALWVLL